jgi:hypothetical protein
MSTDLDFLFDRLLVFVSFRKDCREVQVVQVLVQIESGVVMGCGARSWAARLKTANYE